MIAIAARYGFKTSDNDFDGAMWAFTYGTVTLAGLFGHALGVRAWRNSKLVGALVFAASVLALLISLSNSIGAMAGRGNVQQAERLRVADIVRDARRSLKRAEDEREGLKFTPADGAAVAAAKAKADAPQAGQRSRTPRLQRCETSFGYGMPHPRKSLSRKGKTDRRERQALAREGAGRSHGARST